MPLPFSPGDKAFAYLRDSGHEDQELSIDQQERALREWFAQHGLILSHVYKDEARKGSSAIGREQLQAMMHAFRAGCEEKGVVVWKYNRFARSVDNAQFYRGEIRSLGYIFHSMNDSVPDGPMGRLFEAAIDFKDEQYLIDLSIDVKRGLRDLIEKYKCVPGIPPKGLKREKVVIGARRDGSEHVAHKWVHDPELIPLVLRAFEMRAVKTSISIIQKETHLFGGENSYSTFFSNPIYIGILNYGDLHIENYCEPIVPREIWDRVQAIQKNFGGHRHTASSGVDHPRRANSRFLLSGIANCARCGSPLYGRSAMRKSGKNYDTYLCTRAWRKLDCSKSAIPREKLEQEIIRIFKDILLQPKMLIAAQHELQKSNAGQIAEYHRNKRDITSQLANTRRGIKNINNSIKDMGGSKSLHNSLKELEDQEADLQARLIALEADAVHPIPIIPPETLSALAPNAAAIFNTADLPTKRRLMRALIDHVDVMREGDKLRGTIYYRYPPESLGPPKVPRTLESASIYHDPSGSLLQLS